MRLEKASRSAFTHSILEWRKYLFVYYEIASDGIQSWVSFPEACVSGPI